MTSRLTRLLTQPGFILPFMIYAGDTSLSIIGIPLNMPYSLTITLWMLLAVITVPYLKYAKFKISLEGVMVTIYGLYLLAGALYSPDLMGGLLKALEYLLIIVPAFFAPVLFGHRKQFRRALKLGMLSASSVLLLLGLGVIASGSIGRIAVLGGGPNVYGRLMFFGFMTSFSMFCLPRTTTGHKVRGVLLSTAFVIMMFLSGSRGALVGFIGSLSLLLLFNKRMKARLLKSLLIIIGVLLVVTSLLLLNRGKALQSNVLSRYLLWSQKSSSIAFRTELLTRALRLFEESPIFGKGTNAFPALVELPNAPYPHNLVMETLAEGGILGLVSLLSILLPTSMKAMLIMTRITHDDAEITADVAFAVSGFVFSLIVALFSGDLFDSRYVFFFAGVIINIHDSLMVQDALLKQKQLEC